MPLIPRVLSLVSIALCLVILASFGLFALDETRGASERQASEVGRTQPTEVPTLPEASPRHGQPRRFIDGAAHTLLSPFGSIVTSGSAWARRTVPTLIGLALYGFLLGYLARSLRARA